MADQFPIDVKAGLYRAMHHYDEVVQELPGPAPHASRRIGLNTAIADAFIVVDGEPMDEVSDKGMA